MKGRGALSNRDGRYESSTHAPFDDGWGDGAEDEAPALRTHLHIDRAKTIIARNQSPDVPFSQSINPYRGCEHGCIYCYARPTHAWLGHSPGLEFETEIYYKPDAAARLRQELAAKGYRCAPIAFGANTDAYQPAERKLKTTRSLLELLSQCRHPVMIITKSALVERDIDLLTEMARRNLASVTLSIATVDKSLARVMDPRATAPARRLQTVEKLSAAGIPVGVLIAPVIPFLTDHEMEAIIAAAKKAGARSVGYVLLRLPLEIKDLFAEWLDAHFPLKAAHVLERMRDMHGGSLYRSRWGERQTGRGQYADLIAQRFRLAVKKQRMQSGRLSTLDCAQFRPPRARPEDGRESGRGQMGLF